MATKRVTIPVNIDIDAIRLKLLEDTGIDMSYHQVFNYLIHFYKEYSGIPKTKWNSILNYPPGVR